MHTQQPFEAIVHGALQIGREVQLQDRLQHGYGIRFWNWQRQCHDWQPLVLAGRAYPMDLKVELILGASSDYQDGLELVFGELGTNLGQTAVYFEEGQILTQTIYDDEQAVKILEQIRVTLDPVGFPGSDRLQLLCWVDCDRNFHITINDLATHQILIADQVIGPIH